VVVMTSFISPYRRDRDMARKLHEDANLHFIEVYMDTPLAVCEERDPKGLYEKARAGEIRQFTGIDDPYEPPLNPELVIDTSNLSPSQAAALVLELLEQRGIVSLNQTTNGSCGAAAKPSTADAAES